MSLTQRQDKQRSDARWVILHDNDTGLSGEGYYEWWSVTDGDKSYRCSREDDAKYLCDRLNCDRKMA